MSAPGELPRVLRRTGSRAQAEEWAYVLTALGILHELREESGAVSIAVLPEDAPYLWLAYAALLGSFHLATGPRDERVIWFARGSSDAEAILRGEWWRAATALTLHADYAHAVGNLVVGAFLLWALARRIGPAAAAWIALAGGFLGNALTAAVVRRGYVSVGASTAVFAALGAVALLQAVARRRMALLALGAGSALLGLLGTGQRPDLWPGTRRAARCGSRCWHWQRWPRSRCVG